MACVSPESDIWVGSGCVSGFSSCRWSTVPRVGIFSPPSLSTNERFHFLSIAHAAACRAPSPHHIAKFTPGITKSVNLGLVPPAPPPSLRPAGPFSFCEYVLVVGGREREISRWDRIVISMMGSALEEGRFPFARSCLSVDWPRFAAQLPPPAYSTVRPVLAMIPESSLSAQHLASLRRFRISRVFHFPHTSVVVTSALIRRFLQLRADSARRSHTRASEMIESVRHDRRTDCST